MHTIPKVTFTVSQQAIMHAHRQDEDHGTPPGTTLAKQMRNAADWVEANIGLLPHPGETEWAPESHPVPDTGITLHIATKETRP